jgi:hypothetical protein
MSNTIRTAELLYEESLFSAYDQFFKELVRFDDNRSSWNKLAAVVRDQMNCVHCSIFLEESTAGLRLKGTTGLYGNRPVTDVAYKQKSALGAYELRKVGTSGGRGP